VAFLLTRYRGEFGMLAMPVFVRRLVIPVIFPLKPTSGGRGNLATRVDPNAQVVDVKIVFK
jgi:hypothetical protein